MASALLVAGKTHRQIVAASVAARHPTNMASLSRHKKHIVLSGQEVVPESKVTNIEILETIIQKGFANSKNWKPTISDTMKAMDFWFKMTQGNPFDELLDTLAAASLGEDDPADGTADEMTAQIEGDDDSEG